MDYWIETPDRLHSETLQDTYSVIHPVSPNKQRTTATIGLFINNLFSDYNITIWEGIKKKFQEVGCHLMSYIGGSLNNPYFDNTAKNSVYNLDNLKDISALIIISTSINLYCNRNVVVDFYKAYKKFPIVNIGIAPKGIPCIIINNEPGMQSLMTHLVVDHGYKRIAFLCGPVYSEDAGARYQVYRKVLQKNHIPVKDSLIVQGGFQSDYGRIAVTELLDDRKEGFDALVCINDFTAASAILELRRRGIRVPDDIAVVGFDNITESKLQDQALTTVNQPAYTLGYRAAQIMHDLLSGRRVPMQTQIPSQLVLRSSCGCRKKPVPAYNNYHTLQPADPEIPESHHKMIVQNLISVNFKGVPDKQLITGWVNRLFTALDKEIREESENTFIPALHEIITSADNAVFEVPSWNIIIHYLFTKVVRSFSEPGQVSRINNLLKNSLILIQGIAMQNLTCTFAKSNECERLLYSIKRRLTNVPALDQLKNIIRTEFPAVGIRSCYISVYNTYGGSSGKDQLTLIIAYSDYRLRSHDSGAAFFNLDVLTHGEIHNQASNTVWFTLSLSFQTELLGFVIYELEEKITPLTNVLILNQGSMCETLTDELGNALKNILIPGQEKHIADQGKKASRNAVLPEYKVKAYFKIILLHMEKTAPFLDPDFSLFSLAEQLQIPRSYLSYVINQCANVNFYDFVNNYRIKKAQRLLLETTKKLNILEIAYDSGFKSKSTFNKLFKKITNTTPTDYRKQSLIRQKKFSFAQKDFLSKGETP